MKDKHNKLTNLIWSHRPGTAKSPTPSQHIANIITKHSTFNNADKHILFTTPKAFLQPRLWKKPTPNPNPNPNPKPNPRTHYLNTLPQYITREHNISAEIYL